MAAIPFQIEFVMPDRGFVLARQLEPGPFRVVEGSTLGGCALDPKALDIPRAHNADGSPRLDIFAFLLERREDALRFKVGDRVELAGWRE